jgi:hypothetical protein
MVVAMLASSALAQMSTVPAYITSSKYSSSYPSLSSASLQSMLARQLYASATSPRRTVVSAPTSSPSRYGASANPSIVAIPLYVRNQAAAQKNTALYDILSSPEKKASPSSKYSIHPSKKVYSEPFRSESVTRYEKPAYTYSKYDTPKAAPSSYEPVRSYELKNSEPGYGDASSVSLLSSGYGQQQGSISIAYPPSSYKQSASQSTSRPQLKAVEYDDSQKSALSDFAAALENFDLKSITNQDIYDLPAINPPLTRLTAAKKQPQEQRQSEDSYGSSPSYTSSKSQSYDSPKQSYSPSSSSYEESRTSYAPQSPAAQSYATETYGSYAAPAASSSDSYRPAADSYRPQSQESGRASGYSERPAAEAYRAAGSDSYGSQATYVPAPSNYEAASFAPSQDVYPSRSASSAFERPAAASSQDYYAPAATSVRPNPDDPNCPYKDQASQPEYVPESSSYSGKLTASQTVKEESVVSSGQGYESDELDPSKLDLKIVHLPVSVLKRLVGNGELALPSFNKKK